MLSSGPGLLSHSPAGCAQFIGPVSTNRHASHSIAKSVLIGVQFLFYVILLMVTPSYCFPELLRLPSPPSPFSAQFFCCPLYHSPFIKPVFIFVSCFSGSPTSASSYCGSGEGGSQSGENAPAEVCVSWWKPSSQSPLDQGKSSPPSVIGALWHSVTVTEMSHFSVRTCPNLPRRTIWDPRDYMHPLLHFFKNKSPSARHQNGEVLSTIWEEDTVEQKSTSVLNLKITPADNQAEVCCESFNLVSPSPLSVSGKLTVLCE